MVRFLRAWLVPILAAIMVLGIAISFVPLTRQEQTRAEEELALLMDRAFEHINAGERLASPVLAAEQESLLSKAKAVARFLEHDDALLATDALKALCEQLTIDRIDVSDAEGMLIASSDETRLALPLGEQDAFSWAMEAVDDATAALSKTDETNAGVLYACVARPDIDGFVLLTRDDPYVKNALEEADTEAAIANLPSGSDTLYVSAVGGDDGFYTSSGSLCLRRTQDGITLVAMRPESEVFAVRNAAYLAFGVALICIMICGVAIYLLRLEPVVAIDEDEDEPTEEEEPAALLTEGTEKQDTVLHPRPRKRKKRENDIQEQVEITDDSQQTEKDDNPAADNATVEEKQIQQPPDSKKKRTRQKREEEPQGDGEESFEKIVD